MREHRLAITADSEKIEELKIKINFARKLGLFIISLIFEDNISHVHIDNY